MGLRAWYGPFEVLHNTLADNGAADGEGILLDGAQVRLYSNLIAGHGTGISSTFQAAWDFNGFFNNTAAYGPGLTGGAHDVSGDPHFADAGGGDYHIGPASAMAGRGTDVGVTKDIDGDARPAPVGSQPDLGADEANQHRLFLPLLLR
jgi:hypothetical protein